MSDENNQSVWASVIVLWRYLGKRRNVQFLLLLILMVLAVFAEIMSISAVVPFLTALTSPDFLDEIGFLSEVFDHLGVTEPDDVLFFLTLGFIAATIFATALRIILLWVNARLGVAMGVQLRCDLFVRTLYMPYEYHIGQNSSQIITMATEKSNAALQAGVMHVLLLITSLMLSLAIIVTLLWIDIVVALSAFVVLGGGYILSGYLVKKRIESNSIIIAESQPQAVKCMQEGIGGIRDVIMENNQNAFSQQYRRIVYRLRFAGAQNGFLGNLPKPLLELSAIMLIGILAYNMRSNDAGGNAFPILGALALGAQRLLPSLQQVYFSWASIKGSQAIISEVAEQISIPSTDIHYNSDSEVPLLFNEKIRVQNLNFRYSEAADWVLKNIDFSIKKGNRVGFVGTTGSGKSTLLDIVMGLLRPTEGGVLVDREVITDENLLKWQANIAHVPQSIFLSDASLAENIAFGIPKEKIDYSRIKDVIDQAHMSDFINTLAEGVDTFVGERGVRLSGGQRQRIGIARALYKKAEVIIFDEATSALDSETEESVMRSIESLNKDLTILIIAHRLTTLRKCDVIYKLEKGEIVESGSYTEIIKKHI